MSRCREACRFPPQRFAEETRRGHRGSVLLFACLRAPLWFPACVSNPDTARRRDGGALGAVRPDDWRWQDCSRVGSIRISVSANRPWLLANRPWPLANRPWPLANRSWPLANRSWLLANRPWLLANGSWLLANRSWLLANGSWISANGSWISANGSWISANGSWISANGSWIFRERGHKVVGLPVKSTEYLWCPHLEARKPERAEPAGSQREHACPSWLHGFKIQNWTPPEFKTPPVPRGRAASGRLRQPLAATLTGRYTTPMSLRAPVPLFASLGSVPLSPV